MFHTSFRPIQSVGLRFFTTIKSSGGRLDGKVALITGGADGVGKESSLLFAKEGAKVLVVDLDSNKGNNVVSQIKSNGGQAYFFQADVSKAEQVKAMIEVAEKNYGKLNVLFNNAGIMISEDDDSVNTTEQVWEQTMNVNLKGVFLGCKFGVPALLRAGGGSIINTASFVALMGAATPQIAYTASKGGVLAMSRELAIIHARQNIRVNALCPGPLRTELLDKFLSTPEKRNRRLVHLPMGRFGLADEVAKGALFLASDDSSYVTASTFLVDGGLTAAYVTPI
ncbi:short-chain dehydrogenase/reductase family protein [Heterostelium album PN500]|uniref:Short-chain dehydrogenase/reductase family protein n=1 Tax=Heterostelium pallidum (strain ATCC 26659 / Pp 5 / PN500) TaxID=670386 RepID=D3BAQ8_HETP5|nr:short-chain dehydrogenase/reductase family protein [Heterostelium album PN500]EFA81645.1 short-chain dehydrogenase/reductase family protein [Heterostelium album PN500]|eukprot:XP_020433762.1 short-chain dehydrogenase/reductase family protein [Heterostelium album PN500]